MKDWLDEFVDCKVLINLEERSDRLETSKKELASVGITNFSLFKGIKHSIGISGCSRSHYEIIKLAKEQNYKNVLIFEDDIKFTLERETFRETITNAFLDIQLKNLNVSMLYLGGNLKGMPESGKHEHVRYGRNLFELIGCKTTHAYIVFENVYDTIINNYRKVNWNDPGNWKGDNRYNIDFWYLTHIHHNKIDKTISSIDDLQNRQHRIFGTYPSCAEQRKSYSDNFNDVVYFKLSEGWNNILGGTNGK